MRYYNTEQDGSLTPVESRGDFSNVTTWLATEAQTISVEDSGKTFSLAAGGGSAITLPAAKEGFKARFIIGRAFITTDWVLTVPANIINGGAFINGAFVAAGNENTITLAAGNATIGDYFELEVVGATIAGGLQYHLRGNFAQASAATFTVV